MSLSDRSPRQSLQPDDYRPPSRPTSQQNGIEFLCKDLANLTSRDQIAETSMRANGRVRDDERNSGAMLHDATSVSHVIFDEHTEAKMREDRVSGTKVMASGKTQNDPEFLQKVQQELEDERASLWMKKDLADLTSRDRFVATSMRANGRMRDDERNSGAMLRSATPTSRVIFDGQMEAKMQEDRVTGIRVASGKTLNDQEVLQKVRRQLEDEIERAGLQKKIGIVTFENAAPSRDSVEAASRDFVDLTCREKVTCSKRVNNPMRDETNSGSVLRNATPIDQMIFDNQTEAKVQEDHAFGTRARASGKAANNQEFLQKIQRELEDERAGLQMEMDRLTVSTVLQAAGTGGVGNSIRYDSERDSYVDVSAGIPVFKAFVDVSDFPPGSVSVNVDSLTNKIVVEAIVRGASQQAARTLTQKIPMPRFADDARMRARMNERGILRVEVPLFYYFPEAGDRLEDRTSKAFVYEVRSNQDGSQIMEILVNCGRNVRAHDIHIAVNNNTLVITSERSSGTSPNSATQRTVIKKYTLPPLADIDGITTDRSSDGRLRILIPIRPSRR